MNEVPLFNLSPDPLRHLTRNLRLIVIERAGADSVRLEAQEAHLRLTEEHPPVDRMPDDWGAICEVFMQSAFYYVSVAGVALLAGDRIVLHYADDRDAVMLHVIDIENGRARIQDPGQK